MKGQEVFVLFVEIIENGGTVRQSVESFEKQNDAREELELNAQEETVRCAKEHPNWVMSAGNPDYFECCDANDLHNNHSTAKIVRNVIK